MFSMLNYVHFLPLGVVYMTAFLITLYMSWLLLQYIPRWDGFIIVVIVSVSHVVGDRFAPQPRVIPKIIKNGTNCLPA